MNILQCSLYISQGADEENLIKLVIISYIFVTLLRNLGVML